MWVGGRGEFLSTHISPAQSKAGLWLPSLPSGETPEEALSYLRRGNAPGQRPRSSAESGWTPRPTAHSMCPTSLSHPFTISLGDVPSLHGYGKGCNTRGPDQPFANSHHHAEELTVESARCWSLRACAQSPDPRPGFA